jgi:hypothetical protein
VPDDRAAPLVTTGSGEIGTLLQNYVKGYGMQLESASPVIQLGRTVAQATSVPGSPNEGFVLVYRLDASGKIAYQWVLPAE